MPQTPKLYTGAIANDGTANVIIQQENAATEWNIFQISVAAPASISLNMQAQILYNGFLLCNTPHAVADTASGPPAIILSRGDTLTIAFSRGIAADKVNVTIWYTEHPAGTSEN